LPERLDAISKAGLSLECAIYDGALANAPAAIWPAERGVHKEIEHEKRLAAFRWAPKDAEADAWDQSLDEIGRRRVEGDFVERNKLEAVLLSCVMAVVRSPIVARLLAEPFVA
jgi:hypothetical protein